MADPWNHEKTCQSTSIFSMDETFTGSISLSLRAFMFLALAGNYNVSYFDACKQFRQFIVALFPSYPDIDGFRIIVSMQDSAT